jgi:very-short-patch-repair endonuclease
VESRSVWLKIRGDGRAMRLVVPRRTSGAFIEAAGEAGVDEMDEPPRFHQSSRKFARAQRRDMTRAETLLWRALRNHRLDGHGFRRQTPMGPYCVDFVCLARNLVVEADGRTHETPEAKVRDAERDAWFQRVGFRVLRFPDDLVIGGLPIVIERIRAALREA